MLLYGGANWCVDWISLPLEALVEQGMGLAGGVGGGKGGGGHDAANAMSLPRLGRIALYSHCRRVQASQSRFQFSLARCMSRRATDAQRLIFTHTCAIYCLTVSRSVEWQVDDRKSASFDFARSCQLLRAQTTKY